MRRLLALALFAAACTESADHSLIEPAGLDDFCASDGTAFPFAGLWKLEWHCGGRIATGSSDFTECDPKSSAVDDVASLLVTADGTVLSIVVGPYSGDVDTALGSFDNLDFASGGTDVLVVGCADDATVNVSISTDIAGGREHWMATATRR